MAVTIADLNTLYVEVLSDATLAQNTDFSSANPANITPVSTTSTASNKIVTSGSISAVSITPFTSVDFTPVATNEEVTNESLNRTARTLRDDVNAKMGEFTSSISLSVNGLRTDVASSINTLTTDVNNKLATIKSEQDTQVDAINTQLGNLVTDLNTQIAQVRTAEAQQSSDIANKINLLAGELTANIVKVKNIADNAQQKIAALDDVYGTDSDVANKINTVNTFIATLRSTDLDFLTAVDKTIDEVNMIKRTFSKDILVSAGNGIYNFSTIAEGAGDFINASDYVVEVNAIGNFKARASVENKTNTGFDIRVISHGVHYVPQPVDCAVTPVSVAVSITFEKKNPLTFNVDTLNSSFVTTGAGTDTTVAGAMVLDVTTLNLAVGATGNINALGATVPVTAVVLDTAVATATVLDAVITVTGVAAGTTTITITDTAGTSRTATITVA